MSIATKNVSAEVQYLANDQNLADYIASVAGGDPAEHQGNYVTRRVTMHDGRVETDQLSLDREGFVLGKHLSRVADFYDDEEIADCYTTEIRKLVLELTGACDVEIFDHTRRSSSDKVRREKTLREHASTIHNDYTANSGLSRLDDYLAQHPHRKADLSGRGFAIINVWRSIKGRIENFPLAMCDASSIPLEDLISVPRVSKERIGEIQFVSSGVGHRWVYFPHMDQHEVLLFKTFDSRDDGRARFTPHTAFDDPTASSDAASRESIETRCFVFFAESDDL